MRILDRYILKSIVQIFIANILIFSFLYILIDIASNLQDFIERKVPFEILLQYYAYFFPMILVQTSPIACLIATLFTYSHLNHTNEIIVLRTSGLNFWKICRPAICFSLMLSAVVFWVNERIIPQSASVSNQIRAENMSSLESKQKNKAKIKNLTFYGLKNRLFFIDSFDPNTYELGGITILGYDNDQNIQEKIVALRGEWTGIIWKFYKCQVTEFNNADLQAPLKVKVHEEKLMDIKENPQDFLRQRIDVASMNIKQLGDYIRKFSHSGAAKALNNFKVDLHQKIAFPVANFTIILVGLPFALMTGRRKAVTFTSLGIAIVIGFSYYVLNAVGLALGKGGLFPPILSAWLAPALFSGLAFYLIRTKF